MVACDNKLCEKQYLIFQQILISLEKPVYAPVYFLFEILSNEILEEGFYSKYLHWGSVNKWG